MIGIGVTTFERPEFLKETLEAIEKYTTVPYVLAMVDAGSETENLDACYQWWPARRATISQAKNKCLEKLAECDHIFLFDDDCRPTKDGWWKPFVESPEPHLQYNFLNGPSHWQIRKIGSNGTTDFFDRSRGCMLYAEQKVLSIVGGMHNVFGFHGREHEDWSERIYRAGLTSQPFQTPKQTDLFCRDEREANISSINHSDHQRWRKIDTSKLTRYASYIQQEIPVLVPRRKDYGHRDQLWAFLKNNFWGKYAGVEICEGWHTKGPFNRSYALNRASRSASNWDVAIIADSDAFMPSDRLEEAIQLARTTGKLVAPFDHVIELNETWTKQALETKNLNQDISKTDIENIRREPSSIQSLLLVVPRNLWEQVEGFDERFEGWGREDNAFWKACTLAEGKPIRLKGPAYHLWHKTLNVGGHSANDPLWQKYRRATTLKELP